MQKFYSIFFQKIAVSKGGAFGRSSQGAKSLPRRSASLCVRPQAYKNPRAILCKMARGWFCYQVGSYKELN
jgi:hypothetical protein